MSCGVSFHEKAAKEDVGKRLDLVAAALLGCSRSQAAYAVNAGNVLVNSEKKRPSYSLKPGDHISGQMLAVGSVDPPSPESIPLDIVFADSHILVLNKQAGIVVHPGAGNHSNTLVNGLLAYDPGIAGVGSDPFRPGIVHRLDKDTSGILLVARTSQALSFLQKEFSCRRVKKWYLAMVWGAGLPDTGEIDLPIGRHQVHRKRMAVDAVRGRSAKTSWQVLKRFDDICLVKIRLHTGRTHQIRVHFHSMGYPLLGDPVYGFKKKRQTGFAVPDHQMLHAWKLIFSHPYSGKRVQYTVPLPQKWIQALHIMAGKNL